MAAALAVLVAVPVLARRQPPPEIAPPPPPSGPAAGFTVQSSHRVEFELAPPVDHGDAVTLTWHGAEGLDYAVVIAGESVQTKVVKVGRKDSVRVEVDRGRRYCFQVQATDGMQAYETAAVPIRHAKCRE